MDINQAMQQLGINLTQARNLDKLDGQKDGKISESVFEMAQELIKFKATGGSIKSIFWPKGTQLEQMDELFNSLRHKVCSALFIHPFFSVTQKETFNGRDAEVTRSKFDENQITEVDTGATSEEEACKHMGLNKRRFKTVNGVIRFEYGREYIVQKNGFNYLYEEYYEWDEKTKTMKCSDRSNKGVVQLSTEQLIDSLKNAGSLTNFNETRK